MIMFPSDVSECGIHSIATVPTSRWSWHSHAPLSYSDDQSSQVLFEHVIRAISFKFSSALTEAP